jgi:ABC-type multidrug transport system ATPase subunit
VAPILCADCVGKSFGERRVLSAASLRAEPGQVRVLFGRNGEGKSTLMRIAAGLMQPDSGTVHFDGVPLERARLSVLAGGGVFHLPDHDLLSPRFTLRAHLDMFVRRFGRGVAAEAAAMVGLAERLDQFPHQLSGGELRRAELAVALVRGPRCLLADEPFRGIAPLDAEILARVFRELASRGCAVVFTGHEVETLLAAADHVVWCTDGTTYELGNPTAARLDSRFSRLYLGTTG